MRSFALILAADGADDSKKIEFEAHDPLPVFSILAREAAGRTAILWEGKNRLGTLRRTRTGGWRLTY